MFSSLFLITLTSIGIYVTMLYIVSLFLKRNDIADVGWGIGIVLVALIGYAHAQEQLLSSTVMALIVLWGVRLSVRIFLRNIRKEEDYRYKTWRIAWGKWFYVRSFFQVYILQGLLMIVVGYPMLHIALYGTESPSYVFLSLGLLIWCMGYFFEVVGDYQLDRFLRSAPPKDTVMQSGLWKYTRHPNYFGEVTMWWGIWCMLIPLPFSYGALVSPLMITFLILKVSGIPMLEKRFENNPAFQVYKKRTSAFFPLPPH